MFPFFFQTGIIRHPIFILQTHHKNIGNSCRKYLYRQAGFKL
ncbi:hypothetical protein HMPREF9370_0392 [Neisseria wadsworthii 9715]|uniref:Uncharacterized protein n=1 Tax=Neisseria wadsworthii 9715 TaxID=1030841 RepID=G4CMT3_9NEIS|nr:hypothetical protein HMPREF9370_0392 [Neisseria wadsworthii 9715]